MTTIAVLTIECRREQETRACPAVDCKEDRIHGPDHQLNRYLGHATKPSTAKATRICGQLARGPILVETAPRNEEFGKVISESEIGRGVTWLSELRATPHAS